MEKIILFCLPYAGGSAAIYNKWRKYLQSSIELYPLELAGRGKRFQEPFYANLNEAIEDVYMQIKDLVDKVPYAFFGHSMGSFIAYELYYRVCEMNHQKPVHLFLSGRNAPHIPHIEDNYYNLPDEEFKEKILEKGGTPKEIFENPELQDIFLPILRNDYKLLQTIIYNEKLTKIDCGITFFTGIDDDLTEEEIEGWKVHTNKECKIFRFIGGHFFIHNYEQQLVKIINHTLLNIW